MAYGAAPGAPPTASMTAPVRPMVAMPVLPIPPPPITHRGVNVASKGNISATFEVPGVLSIPSDGVAHNVTIVQLDLEATMSWVCVPKKDARIHLNVISFGSFLSTSN